MSTGDMIKKLRIEKGMTLEELGDKVGVGKSTVRKWENGMIANMRRDKIERLADALGISPLDILGNGENKTLPPNISVPAAHGIPILGTICAGDGVYAVHFYIVRICAKPRKYGMFRGTQAHISAHLC
jgi:repressor LexA